MVWTNGQKKESIGHSWPFLFLETCDWHLFRKGQTVSEDRRPADPVGKATQDGKGDGMLRDRRVAACCACVGVVDGSSLTRQKWLA